MDKMKTAFLLNFVLALFVTAFAGTEGFVDVESNDATIKVDIRGEKHGRCVLRKEVSSLLSRVAQTLKLQGYRLKVTKCYIPNKGEGGETEHEIRHSRGVSVDVIPIDDKGQPMFGPSLDKAMPILKVAMEKEKFQNLSWFPEHFDFEGWKNFAQQNFAPAEVAAKRELSSKK